MTASNKPQGFKNLEVFSISNKTCRGRGIKGGGKEKYRFFTLRSVTTSLSGGFRGWNKKD